MIKQISAIAVLCFGIGAAHAEPIVTITDDRDGKRVSRRVDCGLLGKGAVPERSLLVTCGWVEQVAGGPVCFDKKFRRKPMDAADADRLSTAILWEALRHFTLVFYDCRRAFAEAKIKSGIAPERMDAWLGSSWRLEPKDKCLLIQARDLCKRALSLSE
ncbi:MAG: hypothetical protein B7Y80_17030 [Hyphomicrobium sp. 32-62-53]|nr:MAG: hypothetical protein B7Z29_08140 [Hyphomicrobium sp. 12-62-95]OYX98079.1 MAG: hypothetical protein B7Y80_17030 [Hyphomicrobium sp. 32-62-53]